MFYLLEAPSEQVYQYAYRDEAFVAFRQSKCGECGRMAAELEYDGPHRLIAEGGPRYPDYLAFTGADGPLFVVSERAAQVFRDNLLSGIADVTPIHVAKEKGGELPENAPPICAASGCRKDRSGPFENVPEKEASVPKLRRLRLESPAVPPHARGPGHMGRKRLLPNRQHSGPHRLHGKGSEFDHCKGAEP